MSHPAINERLEQPIEFPKPVDIFLGGVAVGTAEAAQFVSSSVVKGLLFGVAAVSGGAVCRRAVMAEAEAEQSALSVEQYDVMEQA